MEKAVHLLGTRGGVACGRESAQAEADINLVTCRHCIRKHDAIMSDFDRAYPSPSPQVRAAELRMLADMEGGGK